MKASRFSISLYLSLPILISACSIIMIAQFVLFSQGQVPKEGLYQDAYSLLESIKNGWQGFESLDTPFFLLPFVFGSVSGLFNTTDTEGLILIIGSLNFLFLLAGFGSMFFLSLREKSTSAFEVAFLPFLVLFLPAFWKGAFLPTADALLFALFALLLYALLQKKTLLFFMTFWAGLLVSEWFLITFLLPPLLDVLRGSVWKPAYYLIGTAMLLTCLFMVITTIPTSHILFQPSLWSTNISIPSASSLLYVFFSGFSLSFMYMLFRCYKNGFNILSIALSIWFLLLFGFSWMLAGEFAIRVLFISMPLLTLWPYRPKSFQPSIEPFQVAA